MKFTIYAIAYDNTTPIGEGIIRVVEASTQERAIVLFLRDNIDYIPLIAADTERMDEAEKQNGPFPWATLHRGWIKVMTENDLWPMPPLSYEARGRVLDNIAATLAGEENNMVSRIEKPIAKEDFPAAMGKFRGMLNS